MTDFLLETYAAPLRAASRPAGGAFAPAAAAVAVACGAAGSVLAGWLGSGRGTGRAEALAALVAGRVLLELGVWLVAAALLARAERAVSRRGAAAEAPADGGGASCAAAEAAPAGGQGAWTNPVAVALAQRAYLAPVAALARLISLPSLPAVVGPALWIWMAAVLWLTACERGHGAGAAVRLLVLGLAVPVALLAAGLALSGLGWVLAPVFPGGISPWVPL